MTDDSDDPSDLTEQVLAELEPGTVIADRVVLSKRQAAAIMTSGVTLAGVLGLTAGSASAQSGGQLGTEQNPIEANLADTGSEQTADGWQFTIEGDTYQVNE